MYRLVNITNRPICHIAKVPCYEEERSDDVCESDKNELAVSRLATTEDVANVC